MGMFKQGEREETGQQVTEEEAERIRETRKVTNKRGTTKEDSPRKRGSVGRERGREEKSLR
jgi:hypothetical protein